MKNYQLDLYSSYTTEDNNNNIIEDSSICKNMQNRSVEEIMQYYDILNNDISHRLSADDICTPMNCVKLMIDYIPNEFWETKSLKILDPCAGNGNFGAYCQFKTDINNIWFNDINTIRLSNCKKILSPKNLTSTNALNISSFGEWDLIMANPPYSGGGNKNRSLSNEFIEHSIKLLKNGGYLCFVTPNNWMTYNNNNTTLKALLQFGSFIIIDNDVKKYFSNVGSSFTVFIWQKGVMNNKTYVKNNYLIKDEQFNVIIPKTLKYIPLYLSNDIISIINKCYVDTINNFHYRCDLHNHTRKDLLNDIKDDIFCYETIHTPKKTRFSKIKQDIYNNWNIIIPLSTYYIPYIRHNVNVTQSVGYFTFTDEISANKFLQKIIQKHFKLIIHLTRYGNFNNIMVIKHLNFDTDIKFSNAEMEIIDILIKNIKY